MQGLVAFSENGLMIRWWSLGSVWWEKLSRNPVPVQCTKLIFVPPWDGFSPNSTRSSIMASALDNDRQANSPVIFYMVLASFYMFRSMRIHASCRLGKYFFWWTTTIEEKLNQNKYINEWAWRRKYRIYFDL